MQVLLAARRRRRPPGISSSGGSSSGSSGQSVATTYHSAHRGEVRVVIERPPAYADAGADAGEDERVWAERRWPVPPGHPGYYYSGAAGAGAGAGAATEEAADSGSDQPGQWSVETQDGSSSVPETGAGSRGAAAPGRGFRYHHVDIGRAY
ncbi:hypothetical protein SAMD00023353_8700020 [Rosellinia necatrix]|uniref:Uncharacterized protein n=1 Tax=Rosellinia necatrix TaxID=77044 RepID=A0A1W2TW02_ROSNE|nr:hypothetical protein SAMD00023353_8700020 [Rosellinia necatrix]